MFRRSKLFSTSTSVCSLDLDLELTHFHFTRILSNSSVFRSKQLGQQQHRRNLNSDCKSGGSYFSSRSKLKIVDCCISNTITSRTMSRYAKFINKESAKRKPSLIREMTKMLSQADPGTIFMAGGLPNPELFPFRELSVQVDSETSFKVNREGLSSALQYQPTLGYPPFHKTLKELIYKYHQPPNWDDTEVIVTVGSQHGLNIFFGMTMTTGDSVILPQPVYSACLNIIDPYSPDYIPVLEDSQGLQPELLKSILEKRKLNKSEQMPKILYVNPVGANPSGVSIPVDRKKAIYQIACEYDLLILEDDPYFFLHFEKENPQSFLSMDVESRVIRLDSLSKVLSSGLRVGFATGHKDLIRQMELSIQADVLHASSLSQVLVQEVLKGWGAKGFEEHTNRVKDLYLTRRNHMLKYAEKHLSGLADWYVPQGGMFLWMKVRGIKDTYQMVMDKGIKSGIMLLPGREFMPDRSAPCQFLRAAFSVVKIEDMDKGFERLAKLIRDEQARQ